MRVDRVWTGARIATLNPGRAGLGVALARSDKSGTLEAGKWCDLAIWNVERLAELPYRMGFNPLHQRVWRGR